MKFKSWDKDGIAILEPKGKMMGGSDTGELDEKLYSLLGEGRKEVIIDLGQTEWINSSGLSILIHHWKKYNDAGGHLRLANLTQKIERILVISKLTSVFDAYDSLDEAIASFKK
jgi:anti-sigma B factor antagonist